MPLIAPILIPGGQRRLTLPLHAVALEFARTAIWSRGFAPSPSARTPGHGAVSGMHYTTTMKNLDEILTSLRRTSGLSGRELARRAGTTHSALIDYAKGRHDPGFSTLERIAAAAGCDLIVEVRPRLSAPEIRTLEMHRAVAAKIEENNIGVLERARRNLEVLRAADTGANTEPYLAAWEDLIDGPVARLIRVMTSTDQAARDLRQASPFAGVLSDEERLAVIMRTDGVRVAEKAGRSLDDVRQEIAVAIGAGRELVENRP